MWEAIAQNKRRSWMLIGAMGLLLVGLGYVIGAVIYLQWAPVTALAKKTFRAGQVSASLQSNLDRMQKSQDDDSEHVGSKRHLEDMNTLLSQSDRLINLGHDMVAVAKSSGYINPGGFIGAGVAVVVWLIMALVALFGGDSVLLRTAGAYRVEKENAPQLWNVVEEMTIASSLGAMPRVYIIEDDAPNAFAVGRNPEKAAVAVTSGLLKRLTRDELQGVIAHEIGHIRNLDVRFMTLAAVMVGSIVLLSEVFMYYLWFGGGRRSSSRRGGGQAQIILLVVGILAAILAPVVARMLYFACSRRREYLADASAAQFTRFPDGLASALETIAAQPRAEKKVSRTMAPLYIINPLQSRAAVGMFSTHPPTHERVKILRSMGGRAGLNDYEEAYRKVHGAKTHCIGKGTLGASERIDARAPTPEPKSSKEQAIKRAREVVGVLDHLAGFIPIACACGVNLKLPPLFSRAFLLCPRCGTKHDVPTAREDAEKKKSDSRVTGAATYKRKGKGWESFKCPCGGVVQLSPKFAAEHTSCRKCGRHIKIT
ncbi:MAG: M48 family metallopeptidase [Planctomycetes bacterium]|nr:M48 family metallopeptidase [Planctomycetota bacterium]